MVDIKDFVFDKFGILDDVRDFKDFLTETVKDFRRKARVAERLLTETRSLVSSAQSVSELKRIDTRATFAVLRDLQKDLQNLKGKTKRVIQKAQKDPKIWAKIEKDFRRAQTAMAAFDAKLESSIKELVIFQREQKLVLRDVEKGRAAMDQKATRPLSERLGRLVGIMAGVAAALGAIVLTGAFLKGA